MSKLSRTIVLRLVGARETSGLTKRTSGPGSESPFGILTLLQWYCAVATFSLCQHVVWAAERSVAATSTNGSAPQFHIGFSSELFANVNENDALAAVRVWGKASVEEHRVPLEPIPIIFKTHREIQEALRNEEVDAVGMTSIAWNELRENVAVGPILVTYNLGSISEKYLLLTHRDVKITNVAQLSGKSAAILDNFRACLAEPWLDVILAQQKLKPSGAFFGKITRSPKLAKIVLPVFFHQVDACVVTESGFKTMAELNPQVAEQLQPVVVSPDFVTGMFCFRGTYHPPYKQELLSGLQDLHQTPAGQQVLSIFQSQKIEEKPASCLTNVVKLLAEHGRLVPGSPWKEHNKKAGP